MDFVIAKRDFDSALGQILHGRNDTLGDAVDMTANRSTLTVAVTGRSIEVPIEAEVIGSAIIPIKVVFGAKRMCESHKDERLRLRISDGKFRIQNTSISNPGIAMKRISRRIIDIPDDALPMDVLALRHIFSVDEIEDSGLHVKVLNRQEDLTWCLESASATLRDYGISQSELATLVEAKIKAHADAMKHVLFDDGHLSQDQAPDGISRTSGNLNSGRDSAALVHGEAALELARVRFLALGLEDNLDEIATWLEESEQAGFGTVEEKLKTFRAERRRKQCELAVNAGDRFAFQYAEWADTSQFEFFLIYDADMFTEEWIDKYRESHPDQKLGNSAWWKVPGGPDYTQPTDC
jgi:hypothetical protein